MSNFSDSFKHILASLAPTVATALGGPFAGAAVSALTKALGIDPAAGQKAVEDAVIAANPETLAKVRIAEMDFQKSMTELGIQEEQLIYTDIDSARKREIAVKDKTPAVLAYFVTMGFFGALGFLLVNGKPISGGDALLVMLGALGGAWGTIIAYYYGSSSSSKAKTDGLVALANKK